MPAYIGFQTALELSNIFPIKEYVDIGFKNIIAFASQLRRSGSDIVVEEHIVELLGRATLSRKLEEEFKSQVKIQGIRALYEGSDIELHHGPGPTVLRAFGEKNNKAYITTVVTLSMLGYFQPSDQFSSMIDWAMNKRAETRMPNASTSPGFESIASTLQACLSQSSQFFWTTYIQMVEERLRSVIPDYRPHPDHKRMTPTVFLGAIDFLLAAQSLPENRKVIVSNEMGCIPLIIWAFIILELTVVVEGAPNGRLTFGDGREAHVFIQWTGIQTGEGGDLFWPVQSDIADPVIHLQEADATIIISVGPDEDDSLTSIVEERHSLSGYGTTYLSRILNRSVVVSTTEPIIAEIVNLVTGLALHASQKMSKDAHFKNRIGEKRPEVPANLLPFELWRTITSAKLIFAGLAVDEVAADSYRKFYSENSLSEKNLPHTFESFLQRVQRGDSFRSPAQRLIDQIIHMAKIVLLFAHVVNVEHCAAMPLILTDDHVQLSTYMRAVAFNPHKTGLIGPSDIFHGVTTLLSSRVLDSRDDMQKFSSRGAHFLILCSDYGWSVFLTTLGDRDPAQIRPELLHVQQGVPTNKRTMERKMRIRDGLGIRRKEYPDCYPLESGSICQLRSAASTKSRKEFWASKSQEFELTVYVVLRLSQEWQKQAGVQEIDVLMSPREMQDCLWQVHITPECEHGLSLRAGTADIARAAHIRLGPDAAALVGWSNVEEMVGKVYPQRILVLLTHNNLHARWAAILHPTRDSTISERGRTTMLRANNCCEECALAKTAALPGRWALIL